MAKKTRSRKAETKTHFRILLEVEDDPGTPRARVNRVPVFVTEKDEATARNVAWTRASNLAARHVLHILDVRALHTEGSN